MCYERLTHIEDAWGNGNAFSMVIHFNKEIVKNE